MISEIMLLCSLLIFLTVLALLKKERERQFRLKLRIKQQNLYAAFDSKHIDESPYQKYKQYSSKKASPNNSFCFSDKKRCKAEGNNYITSDNKKSNVIVTPPKSQKVYRSQSSDKFYSAKEEKMFNLGNNAGNLNISFTPSFSNTLNTHNISSNSNVYTTFNNHNQLLHNNTQLNPYSQSNVINASVIDKNILDSRRVNKVNLDDMSLSSNLCNIPFNRYDSKVENKETVKFCYKVNKFDLVKNEKKNLIGQFNENSSNTNNVCSNIIIDAHNNKNSDNKKENEFTLPKFGQNANNPTGSFSFVKYNSANLNSNCNSINVSKPKPKQTPFSLIKEIDSNHKSNVNDLSIDLENNENDTFINKYSISLTDNKDKDKGKTNSIAQILNLSDKEIDNKVNISGEISPRFSGFKRFDSFGN